MSDVEVIRERLHYVSDPIVRSAMQGALSRLEEQLEALRNGLEIIASRAYPATYVGAGSGGTKMYGRPEDACNFAREILNRVFSPAKERQ